MAGNMWRWVVVALLARAGAWPQDDPCPDHCECSVSEDRQFECHGENDTLLIMNASYNSYVSVECSGDEAPCLLVPRVQAGPGGRVPAVSTQGCSPALLPCLLAAAGVRATDTLMLTDPTADLLPEHLHGINPQRLYLFGLRSMTEIPSAALAAMPGLTAVRIRDAGSLRLAAGELAVVSQLSYLELSADGIQDLPAGTFRGLSNLKRLYLWKNRIETIQRDSFEGLDSLEELDLSGNSLRALPPAVLGAAPALRVLYLQRNSFQHLGPGVFDGKHLENITIENNKVNLTLGNLTFANGSLKRIILRYSQVSDAPADLFRGSSGLLSLDLAHNRLAELPDTLFQDLVQLEYLNLSYNKILELPAMLFLSLKGLVELNLNNNLIQVLPDQVFAGLGRFERFSMDDNRVHTVSARAFHGAGSLLAVSLAGNCLSLQALGYGSFLRPTPFRYLENARTLRLRNNSIADIFVDWTHRLTQLTELDLSYNNFTVLYTEHIQFLSDKTVVDLRHNHITNIIFHEMPGTGATRDPAARVDVVGRLDTDGRLDLSGQLVPVGPDDTVDDTTASQTVLLLDDNPFDCECDAFPLCLSLRGARTLSALPRLDLGDARCATPAAMTNRSVLTLAPDELVCPLPLCPAPCHLCLHRPQSTSLELVCGSLPDRLPDPTEYAANRIKLKLEDVSLLRRLPDTVYSLNVSGLGLHELQLPDLPHVKELDLRYNRLKTIPEHIMKSKLKLYVSNNSLECSCEYRDHIREMLSRGNIPDLGEVACDDGRKIVDINIGDLCAARDAALVAGTAFSVLVVLSVILSILIYSYHYEILVYLTTRGYLKWLLTEEILDSDKIYDVFVSYSHLDVSFIENDLIPKLEDDFHLKVCHHTRDWVVGDLIPLQVVRSVEQSRKTLIVLSKNFLDSTWAGMEFRTAHCMALKEGRARVLLVILDEEVMTDSRLDRDLNSYLSTNTYLKRDDPKFWERLHCALPPRERKFTFLSKFKRGGKVEKSGGGALDGQLNSEGQIVNVAVQKIV